MSNIFAANLQGGLQAVIIPDRFNPGSQVLIVDGTPQSQVDLDHPERLHFEYVRRIGNVIDLFAPSGAPITALHLGAGALTLPRYIAATRPQSRQQVVELQAELVDFVREHIPLPRTANIRLRYGDARSVVEKLPRGLHGNTDLIVSDIFSGADTPPHVTSVEYYQLLKPLLSPGGVLTINIADGKGLNFGRACVATLAEVFEHTLVLSDSSLLKGHRVGNLVLVASNEPFPDEWYRLLQAAGPHPAKVMIDRELKNFSQSGQIIRDNTPYRGST
ncbi:MAG: fused MFS/spermidine synthase, partial [Microbacteriaceae bacterium]